MSDLKTLLAAEAAHRTDHHWEILFTVRVHSSLVPDREELEKACEHCGVAHRDEDDMTTISDSVTVACGDNAEDAITRAKAHVLDEASYGIKLTADSFKLQGVKLRSIREI